eukprot:TRINITY_DN14043_c0_g1_i1.p1 TRINITY_DN14043_c0_g1~~TRINITY_DN14043_c0_g1_i1.p1  ORF type:complete len:184 (+),score=55.15 TRINITY_DN14043_c0_g1_i1:103-654(+)
MMGGSGTEAALETFERAPPPSSSSSQPGFAYPPGRGDDEDEEERKRRQDDLDGDEELARQLAAQLRLTSAAEHTPPEEDLPRVGDARSAKATFGTTGSAGFATSSNGNDSSGTQPQGVDDHQYGVEYHAMDSDSEDAFLEPPKAMGNAQVICNVIFSLLKATPGPWQKPRTVQTRDTFDTGLG